MKLQQNMSMVVFTDDDYKKISKQIETEYKSLIETSEVGYSYIPFEIDYMKDVFTLHLTGTIEVTVTYYPGDYYTAPYSDTDTKITVETYEVLDDCGMATNSDFDYKQVL